MISSDIHTDTCFCPRTTSHRLGAALRARLAAVATTTAIGCAGAPRTTTPDAAPPPAALVVFGGHFEATEGSDPPTDYFGDAWAWDGTSWTALSTAGPHPRSQAAVATVGGAVMMYGGEGGDPANDRTILQDAWRWDGRAWAGIAPTGPRPLAAATGLECNGTFVLYGGYDETGSNRYDTWVWNGTTWTEHPSSTLVTNRPPPGSPQSSIGQTGGSIHGTCYMLDTTGLLWTWSGTDWRSVEQGSIVPPSRSLAAMATLGDALVLFGGFTTNAQGFTSNDSADLGDTWTWDGARWTEVRVTGPAARSGHAMGSYRGTVVLFGGTHRIDPSAALGTGYFADTWVWSGTAWTQVASTGPGARDAAAMFSE